MEPLSFLKTDTALLEKKLPFETNPLGSFQPYSMWTAPTMAVTGVLRQGSMHSPGLTLTAYNDAVIPANSNLVFPTEVTIDVPFGHFGKIEAVDSLLQKHIVPFSQILESDYDEKIKVCLRNYSDVEFVVKKNDAISQIIFQRYVTPRILHTLK